MICDNFVIFSRVQRSRRSAEYKPNRYKEESDSDPDLKDIGSDDDLTFACSAPGCGKTFPTRFNLTKHEQASGHSGTADGDADMEENSVAITPKVILTEGLSPPKGKSKCAFVI